MAKRIAWSKRARTLLAAGVMPGSLLASIGDFFSPKGWWMLPLALGLVALAVLCFLLLLGTRAAEKVSEGDSELEGWWDGPPWSQLGIWAIASFAASSLLLGLWSHARAADGGVLASNITIVSDAQQQLGLLSSIESNTARTAGATETIRDTVKRETSDDPRKEINNRGQQWSERGFLEAINRADLESVELYLKGRMSIDKVENFVFSLIYNRNYSALDLFERYKLSASLESCRMALFHADSFAINPENGNKKPLDMINLKSNSKVDSDAIRAYEILCSSYPGLPAEILTIEACKKPDYVCKPDEQIDPSDSVAFAMASYRESNAACTIGKERLSAEYNFCRRVLDEID